MRHATLPGLINYIDHEQRVKGKESESNELNQHKTNSEQNFTFYLDFPLHQIISKNF
jgi:hypothetical protein